MKGGIFSIQYSAFSIQFFIFQSNSVGWSLSSFFRIARIKVSRIRRLLLETPYFSQNFSKVRCSFSFSRMDILCSRGAFLAIYQKYKANLPPKLTTYRPTMFVYGTPSTVSTTFIVACCNWVNATMLMAVLGLTWQR